VLIPLAQYLLGLGGGGVSASSHLHGQACGTKDAFDIRRRRTAIARVVSCFDFRDEVGVDLGGRRGGLQRLHGDEAVNAVVHSAMAAMLLAQLTSRLLVAAVVLGAMPLRRGAAHRHGGDLL
jgi:hypothetical protein